MTVKKDRKGHHVTGDFIALSSRILRLASRGLLRKDFLREASAILMDFSQCDAVNICLMEKGRYYRSEALNPVEYGFTYQVRPLPSEIGFELSSLIDDDHLFDLERLFKAMLMGHVDARGDRFSERGSFLVDQVKEPLSIVLSDRELSTTVRFRPEGNFKSLALLPFSIEPKGTGLLVLRCEKKKFFTSGDVVFYEGISQMLGNAISHRRAEVELRERLKELTCLYGIAKMVGRSDVNVDDILRSTVELLQPAWLYPEVTSARIVLDGRQYESKDFRNGVSEISANIEVNGVYRGLVEVSYSKERPQLDEGPFLKDERKLINAVARELALVVEQREADQEKAELQEQLRHADRLATIGQLAAGVAHELNEPLGSILGFAQLAKKSPELPEQAGTDLDRIVAAALHSREVVKKLLIFARQAPLRKDQVDLNSIVKEGLYFLEHRCSKSGIELIRKPAADLPEITADPGQIYQVLVNLVVNAIQAMPYGGTITITTVDEGDEVILIVEDTGIGMDEAVLKKIFIPFYTTKDVDEGTGLGLAVVHGIVSSHSGEIQVDSDVGRGSKFTVRFPLDGHQDNPRSGKVGDVER